MDTPMKRFVFLHYGFEKPTPEIMNAWKCAIMDLSSAVIAGQRANNHQDLLITWLGAAESVFLAQIGKLIGEEVNHAA